MSRYANTRARGDMIIANITRLPGNVNERRSSAAVAIRYIVTISYVMIVFIINNAWEHRWGEGGREMCDGTVFFLFLLIQSAENQRKCYYNTFG